MLLLLLWLCCFFDFHTIYVGVVIDTNSKKISIAKVMHIRMVIERELGFRWEKEELRVEVAKEEVNLAWK